MQSQIQKLINNIIADYTASGFAQWQTDQFPETLSVKTGKKYIKISHGASVWGFVVNTDTDKKFRRGDILLPASSSSPARNHARGNVFEEYSISWKGPRYLK